MSVAGCLNDNGGSETPSDGTTSPDGKGPLTRIAVEGTTLVVELSEETDIDQVNLIQPNGELFGKRDVAAGAQQVSFEIGTAYAPGEYQIVALKGEETVTETSLAIQPELVIRDVGLYRNNPDKHGTKSMAKAKRIRKRMGKHSSPWRIPGVVQKQ
nr:hypothetical protein [Haloferax sp. ATB1]